MADYGFRLRAPRYGGLPPTVARTASEGGSPNPPYGRLRPLAQELIQNNRPERGGADAAEGEAAQRDSEVAGAHHQGDADGDEVAGAGEVDLVLDPDATGGGGDQAEHDDGEA